jgi:adenosylcobinamide-GDP ribazoletransferase
MLADLRAAFAFLTILPVGQPQVSQPGRAFAYYPLVGLVIGLIVAAVESIRLVSPLVTAFLALATWVILTGGLHLDGFADSCDGLLATTTPERRLEIMKDPRAGSWAVIGVVLLLLGKWVVLLTLISRITPIMVMGVIFPPVTGRWAMTLAVAAFPSARPSGLAAYFRDGFGSAQIVGATIITLALWGITAGFAANGLRTFLCLIAAIVVVLLVGNWAAKRLGGGLTGDVYGAMCELVELICLIILSAT